MASHRMKVTARLLLAAVVSLAAGCGATPLSSPALPAKPITPSVPVSRTSIPMKVVTGGHGTLVFVQVQVEGSGPYAFLLDTGSSISSVDRSLVHRLRLPPTGGVQHVKGVNGESIVPMVSVHRWTLGRGAPLRAANLAVVDLSSRVHLGIAGLLGADELRRFGEVTLDFQHQRLIVRNP